jgi:nickel-dependent lactate racemase
VTEYELPYGKNNLTFHLPDSFCVDTLVPETLQPIPDIEGAITQAFTEPLGSCRLEDFKGASSVGIAINDKTRPIPKPNPIPALLEHLERLGFRKEAVTLFIGSGTHTPMTADELHEILSEEIIAGYRIIAHDCDHSPMVGLGMTAYQTHVQINQAFYNCDLKITVGNIEPHHFMGFSGGVKTAAIGLASRETITANHAMLTSDNTCSGLYYINPMRQDLEEIGQKAGIHFSLGTILDEDKYIIQILFGNPLSVMKAAIPTVRRIFGVTAKEPYDLVIASPGGYPKDINLYQAQKGLTHAARITKDNGWVILLAACPEVSGSQSYEDYILSAGSSQTILKEFKAGFFQVGPHKAFQIAREVVRVNFVLVSDIPAEYVKQWKLTPSKPELLDQLIKWVTDTFEADARIALLPAATRTMTEVKQND